MIAQLTGYQRHTSNATKDEIFTPSSEADALKTAKSLATDNPQNSGWCRKSKDLNQYVLFTPKQRFVLGIYDADYIPF